MIEIILDIAISLLISIHDALFENYQPSGYLEGFNAGMKHALDTQVYMEAHSKAYESLRDYLVAEDATEEGLWDETL